MEKGVFNILWTVPQRINSRHVVILFSILPLKRNMEKFFIQFASSVLNYDTGIIKSIKYDTSHTQRRVLPDQCYFTVQITGSNFECSL